MTFIQLKKTILALLICLVCSMEAEGAGKIAPKPPTQQKPLPAANPPKIDSNKPVPPIPAPKKPATAPQKLDENATEEVDDTVKTPKNIDELLTTEELTSQKETEEKKTELFEQKNATEPRLAREKWLAAQDKAIELTADLDDARAALKEKTQDAAKTLQRASTMPSMKTYKK